MCKKHPHPHSLVHLALVLYHKMLLACGISSTGSIDKFSNRVRTVTFKVVDLIDGIESSKFDSALQTQRLRCLFFLTWRRKMFFCCSFVIKKQSILTNYSYSKKYFNVCRYLYCVRGIFWKLEQTHFYTYVWLFYFTRTYSNLSNNQCQMIFQRIPIIVNQLIILWKSLINYWMPII